MQDLTPISHIGLQYNYFRDYDASTGRYVESDPIGLNGGLNLYVYVSANPVNNIDLFGLYKCLCLLKKHHHVSLCQYKCICKCSKDSDKNSSHDFGFFIDYRFKGRCPTENKGSTALTIETTDEEDKNKYSRESIDKLHKKVKEDCESDSC